MFGNWKKKVSDIIPIKSRNDAGAFGVCLLLSAFLWFGVTGKLDNDATVTVELQIVGQPPSAVFTTHLPEELKVTLHDTNWQLFFSNPKSRLKTLSVDFDRYADAGGYFRISGAELQSLLQNQLDPGTKITTITPSLVDARFAMTNGKMLPVRIAGLHTIAPNHMGYTPVLKPDSVLVHAPNYILDTLKCIYTEPLAVYGLKDTLRTKLGLHLKVGTKVTPDSVSLEIPVVQYVEKRFDNMPIKTVNLPHGKRLALFPRQASVRMMANFSQYKQITADMFVLSVSYDSIHSANQQFLPITLSTTLDSTSIRLVQLIPDHVEYTIEQ